MCCCQVCTWAICKNHNYWSVCLDLNISRCRICCLHSCYNFCFFFISKCWWIVYHSHFWSLDAVCFLSFFSRNYWFFFRILSSFNWFFSFFFSHYCSWSHWWCWSYFYSWCYISTISFTYSWLSCLRSRTCFWLGFYCIRFDWWSYQCCPNRKDKRTTKQEMFPFFDHSPVLLLCIFTIKIHLYISFCVFFSIVYTTYIFIIKYVLNFVKEL